MDKHVTATQAVRKFSEILNTIKFRGAHYIIERGGKPIAFMKPVDEETHPVALRNLKELLKKLPKLDEELDSFAADLEDILQDQPLLPKGAIWD